MNQYLKFLLVAITLVFAAPAYAEVNPSQETYDDIGLNGTVYAESMNFAQDLQAIAEEGRGEVTAEGWLSKKRRDRVKKRTEKFYNHLRSKRFAQSFLKFTEGEDIQTPEQMQGKVVDWLIKVWGSAAVKAIRSALGVEEFAQHTLKIYFSFGMIKDPLTCEEGIFQLAGSLAFVSGFLASWYYFKHPFFSKAAGIIAKKAAELVIDWTRADERLCALIHRKRESAYLREDDFLNFAY